MLRVLVISIIIGAVALVAYLGNTHDEAVAKAQLNAVRAAVQDYAADHRGNYPEPQSFEALVTGDLAQYLGTGYDDLCDYSGFDVRTLRYSVYENPNGTFYEISGTCRSYTKNIIAASSAFAATAAEAMTANARYVTTGER